MCRTRSRCCQGTAYGPDIEAEVIHGVTAAMVDEALKDNAVARSGRSSTSSIPRRASILTVLLGRWDVQNIKTVLRGAQNSVASGAGQGEPAAARVHLRRTSSRRSREPTTSMRSSTRMAMWGIPYASPLREGIQRLRDHGRPRPTSSWRSTSVLGGLSRPRVWIAMRENYKVARRILATQIDVLNLVMVFRLLRADAPGGARPAVLPRGRTLHRRASCSSSSPHCRTSTKCSTG